MKYKGGNNVCRNGKSIGITVAAFGLGMLIAFFLPEPVLVVLQASVIVCAGCLFFKN